MDPYDDDEVPPQGVLNQDQSRAFPLLIIMFKQNQTLLSSEPRGVSPPWQFGCRVDLFRVLEKIPLVALSVHPYNQMWPPKCLVMGFDAFKAS